MRCTNSTRQTLQESEETWKDVFHAKRLISFQGFDEIFGHILGDPDEHFGLFTGDDVKKRARARALALAQLRKLHGGSKRNRSAQRRERRRKWRRRNVPSGWRTW